MKCQMILKKICIIICRIGIKNKINRKKWKQENGNETKKKNE